MLTKTKKNIRKKKKSQQNKRPIGLGALVVVLVMHDLKWPWHVQGQKYQHAFSIHPSDPNLILSLYDETFLSHGPIFRKVHRMTQMTLTCSKSKIPTCMLYTPPPPPRGTNFCPFRSTMSCSWVTRLFKKSAPNDLKWPWHVQGQKYQHACCKHPRGPNFFVRFALWWAILDLQANFWKSAPNDPKSP